MARRSKRGGGRPTIADVARRAGVGAMTVSRAISDPERVSPALRGQIHAAIEELGYVLDRNARALAAARADIVAVLIPSLANSVFSDVVRGLYAGLGDSPLQIQLGNTHYSGLEEERLLRVFLSQRPSAIVVSGIDQTPAARELLREAGCPVVQIMELGPEPIDLMVGFSQFDCGRVAVEHLLDQGYRRIAFLGARPRPAPAAPAGGLSPGDGKAGLFDPQLVTTVANRTSVSLGRELLRDALARAPDLDALVCSNDDVALGALFECNRSAVRGARNASASSAATTSSCRRSPSPRSPASTRRGSRSAAGPWNWPGPSLPARRSPSRWSIWASNCRSGKASRAAA